MAFVECWSGFDGADVSESYYCPVYGIALVFVVVVGSHVIVGVTAAAAAAAEGRNYFMMGCRSRN